MALLCCFRTLPRHSLIPLPQPCPSMFHHTTITCLMPLPLSCLQWYIIGTSHIHHGCITGTSRIHHGYITHTSWVHHRYITYTSHILNKQLTCCTISGYSLDNKQLSFYTISDCNMKGKVASLLQQKQVHFLNKNGGDKITTSHPPFISSISISLYYA